MGVHSVLCESLRLGNISIPGSVRMDNTPDGSHLVSALL